jgi:hypothetical protein
VPRFGARRRTQQMVHEKILALPLLHIH